MAPDDQLTALLSRAVETVEPSEDLWARTQRRARRAVHRSVARRVSVTVLALAIAAVAVPVGTRLGRDTVTFSEGSDPAPADPVQGTWEALAPPPIVGGRIGHTATWAGDRMIVFGGEAVWGDVTADGAQLLPEAQRWESLPPGPVGARKYHSAVWTGAQLLVWGGTNGTEELDDGAAFDPASGTWEVLPAAPLAGRWGHSAVWTGTEMIVWGGMGDKDVPFTDGAAYNPATRTWRAVEPGPLTPRQAHRAVWTGTEMIVWGGQPYGEAARQNSEAFSPDAAYDPAEGTWRILADAPPLGMVGGVVEWTGDRLLVWGGYEYRDDLSSEWDHNAGAAYDPTADAWTPLPASPLTGRRGAASVWTGSGLLVWGGLSVDLETSQDVVHDDGALYEPSRGVWVRLASSPLSARLGATAVWAGDQALIWGGSDTIGGVSLADGAAYTPPPEGQGRPAPAAPEPEPGPPEVAVAEAGPEYDHRWARIADGRVVTPDGERTLDDGPGALALTVRPGSTEEEFEAVVLVDEGGEYRFLHLTGPYADPGTQPLPEAVQPTPGLPVPPVPVFSSDGADLGWLEVRPPGETVLSTASWGGTAPVPGTGVPLDIADPPNVDPGAVALALLGWYINDPSGRTSALHIVSKLELATGYSSDSYTLQAERVPGEGLVFPDTRLEPEPG